MHAHRFFVILQLDSQCSAMQCPVNFNCCKQSGICPTNRICVPLNSPDKPWKRFACKCPGGYHGNNCDQPIRSCREYASGSPVSGKYKVVDYEGTMYEVFCHFGADGTITLVQSYSFEKSSRSDSPFRVPLYNNQPISENDHNWGAYRLSNSRMKSVRDSSSFLLFSCEYEKTGDVKKSDHVQVKLQDIDDFLEDDVYMNSYAYIGHGKLHGYNLSVCDMKLHQTPSQAFHAHFNTARFDCKLRQLSCDTRSYDFFGNYASINPCVNQVHKCTASPASTTQLWFGVSNP